MYDCLQFYICHIFRMASDSDFEESNIYVRRENKFLPKPISSRKGKKGKKNKASTAFFETDNVIDDNGGIVQFRSVNESKIAPKKLVLPPKYKPVFRPKQRNTLLVGMFLEIFIFEN